ncbi:hypothetical protein [Pseudomonas sp.]|uniref:hypothetical protein n=1 Tax=Pseudomonas sp. TaxID=306 RepID=UPI00260210C7|nr:hypothetical protein [Pseudomonas sp.]
MNVLWSLFTLHSKHRHYAYLDKSGICRAFRLCSTAPTAAGWVEIDESCPSWLNRPLPDRARSAKPQASFSNHTAVTH